MAAAPTLMQMAPGNPMSMLGKPQQMDWDKKEFNVKGRCESCCGARKFILHPSHAEYHQTECCETCGPCMCCKETVDVSAPYAKMDKLKLATHWGCCLCALCPQSSQCLCAGFRGGLPQDRICFSILTENGSAKEFTTAYEELRNRVMCTPATAPVKARADAKQEGAPVVVSDGNATFTIYKHAIEQKNVACCCCPGYCEKDTFTQSYMFDGIDEISVGNRNAVLMASSMCCATMGLSMAILPCCAMQCADVEIPGVMATSYNCPCCTTCCNMPGCSGRSGARKMYAVIKERLGQDHESVKGKGEKINLNCCGCSNHVQFDPTVFEMQNHSCCDLCFDYSAITYKSIQSVEKRSNCMCHYVIVKTEQQLRERPDAPYVVSTALGSAATKVYNELVERSIPAKPVEAIQVQPVQMVMMGAQGMAQQVMSGAQQYVTQAK